MRDVSFTEQNGSCMGAVDIDPLKYDVFTGVMVAGGKGRGTGLLQSVTG